MEDFKIAGRRAIVLGNMKTDNPTYYEFIPFCKLIHNNKTNKSGTWKIDRDRLFVSTEDGSKVNFLISKDEVLYGHFIDESHFGKRITALLFYKRNNGDLKARICFYLNLFNSAQKVNNGIIKIAQIDKWINRFPESNHELVLSGLCRILEEYLKGDTFSHKIISFFTINLEYFERNIKIKNFIVNLEFLSSTASNLYDELFVGDKITLFELMKNERINSNKIAKREERQQQNEEKIRSQRKLDRPRFRILRNYKYYIIYKTTNTKNNKIYIGQHCTNDLNDDYMGSGKSITSEILINGNKHLKREIIEYCNDREELNRREKYWIKFFESQNPKIGLNKHEGGKIKFKYFKKKRWDNI